MLSRIPKDVLLEIGKLLPCSKSYGTIFWDSKKTRCDSTCNDACRKGHLVCLSYVYENSLDLAGNLVLKNIWDSYTYQYAAAHGHTDCIKFIFDRVGSSMVWNEYTCIDTAKNGHLECLKFLHDNSDGSNWSSAFVCEYAAMGGHLDCLRYGYETMTGIDVWGARACSYAAQSGQLECLIFLHENGCGWNWSVCALAAENDHVDCLRYAIENGCVSQEFINNIINHFVVGEKCLQYLSQEREK